MPGGCQSRSLAPAAGATSSPEHSGWNGAWGHACNVERLLREQWPKTGSGARGYISSQWQHSFSGHAQVIMSRVSELKPIVPCRLAPVSSKCGLQASWGQRQSIKWLVLHEVRGLPNEMKRDSACICSVQTHALWPGDLAACAPCPAPFICMVRFHVYSMLADLIHGGKSVSL